MQKIFEEANFQKLLAEIAAVEERELEAVQKEAKGYLREMYTQQHPLGTIGGVQAIEYVLGRAYDQNIDTDPEEIKKLSRLMRRHPIAFVMTHKTYIDMAVLALVMARYGLPIPFIFSGINLNFMGFAQFAKQTGIIFLRRSFKNNKVYKVTLRHYIASLLNEKASFMWSIEGTRSRTGKLVWPQMGILKYIMEGEEASPEEVKYIPVSIVYDLIPDVKDMTREAQGQAKKAESFFWMVDYIQKMGTKMGRIAIRFGDPVDVREEHHVRLPESTLALAPARQKVPRLAFELVHRINQITPVTTTSLICVILLSKFSLTKHDLEYFVVTLMQYIESHHPHVLIDRGKPIGESVQTALNLLLKENLVALSGQRHNARYRIKKTNHLQSSYYANMVVHHLYHRAFIELAAVHLAEQPVEGRELAFWTRIMEIRDLFKFEFFYSSRAEFTEEIEADLSLAHPEWRERFFQSDTDLMKVLRRQELLVAPVVLATYVEAYQVVGQALKQWDPHESFDEGLFIGICEAVGEEMEWNGTIRRVESASKPFLVNGIRLVKNRQLIPTVMDHKEEAINAFLQELEQISEDIRQLQKFVTDNSMTSEHLVPLEYNVVPGSKTETIISSIVDEEEGPHIGAFFDLDRTLISSYSAAEFAKSRILSGKVLPQEVVAQFAGVLVYAMGNKNFAGFMSLGTQGLNGVEEKIFVELGEDIYLKHLADSIYPESRALVAAHLAKGHTVAIITAATPYQVNPIARDLEVEHVMCTQMEVKDGRFTGKMIEPTCWGEGKAHYAMQLVEEHQLDLAKSYFYTDSVVDLPLLEIVGNPRPMNPDAELSKLAFQNGWPIYHFNTHSSPGLTSVARTAMVGASLFPAMMSGLFTGFTSGSTREGINSMVATVGDITTTMAGIQLAIKGQEYLEHRPAVFIMNHQSNVDAFIAAKLLRHDIIGVAKKSVKNYPVIGQIMAAAGVIFIDRKNREKAIESLKPAVDALHNGKSIMILPEGTRSRDYTLGDFKKGAFHIAMAAEAPIVPIIVHNAHDAMPKGAFFVKPTVIQCEVLPPISTKGWTKADLDHHIGIIRQVYLDKLGQ